MPPNVKKRDSNHIGQNECNIAETSTINSSIRGATHCKQLDFNLTLKTIHFAL